MLWMQWGAGGEWRPPRALGAVGAIACGVGRALRSFWYRVVESVFAAMTSLASSMLNAKCLQRETHHLGLNFTSQSPRRMSPEARPTASRCTIRTLPTKVLRALNGLKIHVALLLT